MAATVNSNSVVATNSPLGPTTRVTSTVITGDASYPTGGYALTAAQLGLSVVGDAIASIAGSATNNAADAASWNQATGKLQLFTSGTTGALVEQTAATNVSGITVKIIAFGF